MSRKQVSKLEKVHLSKAVSMPGEFWEIVDKKAQREDKNRSRYIYDSLKIYFANEYNPKKGEAK